LVSCLEFTHRCRWLFLSLAIVSLAGCGTWTPLPSHGGGRRFAVEQALVSAAARSAISQLPLQDLRGQSVNVEVHIIHDEGSGFIAGGRPLASDLVSGSAGVAQATVRGSRTTNLTSSLSATTRASEYQNKRKKGKGSLIMSKELGLFDTIFVKLETLLKFQFLG